MKVALFASAFYPHMGGVEELVRQLAHAYPRAGVPAIVITNRWPHDLPTFENYEGIPLYRLLMRVPEGSWKARLSYQLTHRAVEREMVGILKKHSIDMLHIQCVSSNGFYALRAKHTLNLPLVMTTQGERTMDASGLYQRSAFMNHNLKQLLAEANYITACSQSTLDDMENYWGRRFDDRAQVVYNGIELNDFERGEAYSHAKPYILGIGRFVPQKGFDVLLNAFAQAKLDSHDLLLAGDGPERTTLEQTAQKLGLQNRVHFLGRADRPMAVALFKGCSFFVLPSRHEPQGIVNLEAMAAGKAVIASAVGGVPEIVLQDETGLLVKSEDVDALTAAIVHLANNSDLRERLGAAGRRRAADFTWPTIAQQYLDIYHKVGQLSPT